MTKKFVYNLHLWLSIPLGIFITLICLSGATLVFKSEIRDALGMPRVVAPHGHHDKAHGGKAKAGDVTVEEVGGHKAATEAKSHHHAKAEGSAATGKHGKDKSDKHGTTTKRDFFSYVTKFHTSLMMGTVGKYVVTYTTLAFAIILITGLWVCWPRNAQQWKQRFSIERHKGSRRLLHDLHVTLGYWALLWILAIAVTGMGIGMHIVPKGTETMRIFHEIHIGSWGGIITKCITFAVSLIGASLPITGYWIYFKKRSKKVNG